MTPEIEDAYPLTRLQAGMLFHSRLDDERFTYHDLSSLMVGGPFDEAVLRGVLNALAAAHEVLRSTVDLTRFSEPMQFVHAAAKPQLTVEDLRDLSEPERDARVARWRAEEKIRPFDLATAPLLRVHVQRIADDAFWLNLSFHHAILDGWSLSVLTSTLLREYDRALEGHAPEVPKPATRFRDYVLLERKTLADPAASAYWRDMLADVDATEIPRWHDTAADVEQSAGLYRVPLPADVTPKVRAVAARARVPVKALLFAAHAAVLAQLTGQHQVVTGRVTNGRPESQDADRMVGIFLNVLPMVLDTDGVSWLDLARQAHRAEIDALAHRRYPLSHVLRESGKDSLLGTLVDFRDMRSYGDLSYEHLKVEDSEFFEQTNFPFSANYGTDVETGEIRLRINYHRSEFSAARIEAIGGYYAVAFGALIADPETPVSATLLLGEPELRRQLIEWNQTATELPLDRTVCELLPGRTGPEGDRIAVRCGSRTLTYAELQRRANHLAWRLRESGVGPESVVGVHMGRSPELIVALLAVFKAGGAYLPLDPAYPADRLGFMIADGGARVVLADPGRLPPTEASVIFVEPPTPGSAAAEYERAGEPERRSKPDDLAYTIYTSGSTGVPKGVQVPQRALVNLLASMSREVGLTADDRWLAMTSMSFDIAGLEVFAPLLAGAELIVLPDLAVDGPRLLAELESSAPTIAQATPSAWRLLVEAGLGDRPEMRGICGGEALPAELAQRLCARLGALWNAYGPTETTIWSCLDRVRAGVPITIGTPLANTGAYVLDQRLQPVPVGSVGELYLSGDGVARGYRGRPAMTAGRFVAAPWGEPGSRLFRTGDIVRWRPDGRLEFLGRDDHQVKVRGYRIELGEIETVLGGHRGVGQAIVVPRVDGSGWQQLVAYLAMRTGSDTPDPAALRAHVAAKLPDHMVPSAFVVLDAFPLTPNGKVDRKALPDPNREHAASRAFVEPETDTQRLIAGYWEQELGLDRVGLTDTFRELGGHSIAALRIVLRIKEASGVDVPMGNLLTGGTVATLAEAVDDGDRPAASVRVPLRETAGQTPLFLFHPLGGSVFCYLKLTDALPADQPVHAFQAFDLAGPHGPRPATVEEMAELFLREVRAVQPYGPYRLGGWCMGGVIAYEMARQLQRDGERIELLALVSAAIDDPVPSEYAVDEVAATLGAFGDNLPLTRERLRAVEPEQRLRYVLSLARGELARADVGGEDDLRRLVGLFQRHARALLAYRDGVREPYRGDLLLVRAEAGRYASPDLGWAGRLDGELVLIDSPGEHSTVLSEPNASDLAERLMLAVRDGTRAARRFAAPEETPYG